MTSLRHDLLGRRLWLVVAILILAIAAVPFVMKAHGSSAADMSIPLPPHVTVGAVPVDGSSSKTASMAELIKTIPRDPFAAGMPKLASKPASASSSSTSSGTATTASTSGATATSATTPSMVSPVPVSTGSSSGTSASSGSSSSGSPASSAGATGEAASATTTVTATQTSTTSGAQSASLEPVPSWTLYSVAVRFGADETAAVRQNVARLTPLPSAAQPEVMFMGVLPKGDAVFAFGAGVTHSGPGICRPDHKRCAAIVLAPGDVETITYPGANGTTVTKVLQVVSMASTVTHSKSAALAAYQRHSSVGQCELDLAHPVTYSATTGTLTTVSATACHGIKGAVPFTGALSAS